MILKPMIRNNIAINAHPIGCKEQLIQQVNHLKNLPTIQDKPINVLVIGGSSGYGLATQLVLATKAQATIYSVSFERQSRGRSTASAGTYNNQAFKMQFPESTILNADCFAHETKQTVIQHFRQNNQTIDLVVYSVASGIRFDPDTQVKYQSALKPIGKPFHGVSVDIAEETLINQTLNPAIPQEIEETVKVMGGADYLLWATALKDANVLSDHCKFVTYTYLGSPLTHPIYRDGTIGQAKKDLEYAHKQINDLLAPIHGQSILVAAKAVVTKASIFIPTMALYASALFKVMKEKGTHESTEMHMYRLYKDMIYGDKPELDENGIYRLDAYEMDPDTQVQVSTLLQTLDKDTFKAQVAFKDFKKAFLQLNGFEIDGVDYDSDVSDYI